MSQNDQKLQSTLFSNVCLFSCFVYIPFDCIHFSYLLFIPALLPFIFYSCTVEGIKFLCKCAMTIRGFSILFYSIVYVQGTQSVFLKRTHYNKNGEEHILVIMNKNVNNIIKGPVGYDTKQTYFFLTSCLKTFILNWHH